MSLPTSKLAYPDCLDAYEKALESEKGARVKVADRDAAYVLRGRLHQARVLDRADNAKLYDKGHPMHGRSTFDPIRVSIKKTKSGFYVYLEQVTLSKEAVEDLSQVKEEPETVTPPPLSQITPLIIEQIKRRA